MKFQNLNSVLDDNKMHTLPNGERLSLPPNLRILFEVQDLKYATLATVSRCGMVWFSEEILKTEMIYNHFMTCLRIIPLDEVSESFMTQRSKSPGSFQRGRGALIHYEGTAHGS